MKQITLNYLGMYATGETVKEAKQKAAAKIEKALTADYTPQYIERNGISALCYRDPRGWNYLFWGRTAIICNTDSREEVIQAASSHIEQALWTLESDDSFPLLDSYPNKKRELQSWANWQRDYARLKALGHDDEYCHTNASSAPRKEG